jgi:hypothetical protein
MHIQKLLKIAGPALATPLATARISSSEGLRALLVQRNGFFAFESALHVFSTNSSPLSYGLDEWNSSNLWRRSYGDLTDGLLFFAEDVFGGQFCLKDEKVYSFNPETGDLAPIAEDLEAWAHAVLDDYDFLTGYSLAHEWQEKNGALESKSRLIPKVPFVCGGEYNVENLIAIDAVRAMRSRGNLATQIQTLPDGSQITFNLVD